MLAMSASRRPAVLVESGVQIDLHDGEIRGLDTPRRLTQLELAAFLYLLERANQIVSKEELLTEVWGYSKHSRSRTLHTSMARIRAKVEPSPAAPRMLMTVRGQGYKLCIREEALPVQPTHAWPPSRAELCDAAVEALRQGRHVVLSGAPGVGKSTMAAAIASEGANPFGIAVYVDLHGVNSEADAVSTTARAVQATAADALGLVAEISAMRDALLVVDGAHGCTGFLRRLLRDPKTTTVRILATVRTWPDPSTTTTWSTAVGPLDEFAAQQVVARALSDSGADPSSWPLPARQAVIKAVDANPRAIELIMAQARWLDAETIQGALLADRPPGLDALREAYRSLRGHVSEGALAVLGLLTVFPDRFRLDDGVAICVEANLNQFQELIDACLLQVVSSHHQAWFRVPHVVRSLCPDVPLEVRVRHATRVAAQAREWGLAGQVTRTYRIRQDIEQALRIAVDNDLEDVQRTLLSYAALVIPPSPLRARQIAASMQQADDDHRPRLLVAAAWAHIAEGDWSAGLDSASLAVSHTQTAGDRVLRGMNLASLQGQLGDVEAAGKSLRAAAGLATGARLELCRWRLAWWELERGNTASATDYARETPGEYLLPMELWTLVRLAIRYRLGHTADALTKAIQIADEPTGVVATQVLFWLLAAQDFDQAARWAFHPNVAATALSIPYLLPARAAVLCTQGQPSEAAILLEHPSLRGAPEGSRIEVATASARGLVAWQRGDPQVESIRDRLSRRPDGDGLADALKHCFLRCYEARRQT
jgi:DNA-binding winged helix-turn-helix (wHTH) protein